MNIMENVIDISKYNIVVDFNAVKESGISGVIIRCGYRGYSAGNIKEDDKFKQHIKGATDAGLKVGLYFMSQAITESEAIAEAEFCAKCANGYKLSYPIFYDSEYSNEQKNGRADHLSVIARTSICKAFLIKLNELGFKSGTYASKAWFYDHLNFNELDSFYVWVAQYNYVNSFMGRYDMWQYTSKGFVKGISGFVDISHVYTDFNSTAAPVPMPPQDQSYMNLLPGVNTYSYKLVGNDVIALNGKPTNFKILEFRCGDGSDAIKIDYDLVVLLQKIRDHFNRPLSINSGYRTEAYNSKIGGANNSYHTKGQAADIKIQGVEPIEIASFVESIGGKGIGVYQTFTHVDTRQTKYYWTNNGNEVKVESFLKPSNTFPTLMFGSTGQYVTRLQTILASKGYTVGSIDGKFGAKTLAAVKTFQQDNGLVTDGIVGSKTWLALNK